MTKEKINLNRFFTIGFLSLKLALIEGEGTGVYNSVKRSYNTGPVLV
jgi:hypothetical protein